MTIPTDWRELIAQVPREPFIPEIIWVDIGAAHSQSGFNALSKHDYLERWRELVSGDEPVITQVDEGHTAAGDTGWSPSSSCSKPSIVAGMLDALDLCPGHSVLEIGTGTGWNAALLCRRVGMRGRVVSIEVDPVIADDARAALAATGCGLRTHRRRFYEPDQTHLQHAQVSWNSMTSPPAHADSGTKL